MGKALKMIGAGLQKGLEARDKAKEKIVGGAQEVRNQIGEVAENTRAEISGRGPGFISQCKDMGAKTANIPMTSCRHLVNAGMEGLTLHPINAAKEVINSGTSAIKNTTTTLLGTTALAASATRGVVDTTGKVVATPFKAVKAIAKLPIKAGKLPIAAVTAIPKGVDKMDKIFKRIQAWDNAGEAKKDKEAAPDMASKEAPGQSTEAGSPQSKAEKLTGIPDQPPTAANDNVPTEDATEAVAAEASTGDTGQTEEAPVAQNDNGEVQAKAA